MWFLGRFLAALAIVSSLYVIPLRAVNPEGDFREGLLAPIVVDARETKMSQLRSGADVRAYDALVLGSSRSMQLGPEIDARYGTHAYNFAVDNAHTEDYLAIYHWAKSVGLHPRLLAIGVDLEALHDSDKTDERYDRNPELIGALGGRTEPQRTFDALSTEVQKYKRMFTTWYVRDAVQSVRVQLSSELPPQIEALGDDGLLRYPRWDAQRAAGTFALASEITACIPLYVDRFRDMHGFSARRTGYLDQLMREAAADGASVVAWLTPVRQETIDALASSTEYARLVKDGAALLQGIAARAGARWRDLSDPASFGASNDGWYDCAHPDRSNLARLVSALPR